MLAIIPLLTDPGANGFDAADSFDVVVPSLPGFGFSDRPANEGMNALRVADIWVELMHALGYDHFAAQGGSLGAGVSTALGLRHREHTSGIHLNFIPGSYLPHMADEMAPTPAEQKFAGEANQRIRRITNGIITTVAGNGGLDYSDGGISAVDAGVIIPAGMAADSSGNFTDSGYGRIRQLIESLLLTVAGIGAPFTIMQQTSAAALASLAQPVGVAVNSAGALLISDIWNDCIRLVSSQGLIDTIAGQLTAAGPLNDPTLASSTYFFHAGRTRN